MFATRTLRFDAPVLMGVVNVTPDSFSDGGSFADPDHAAEHAAGLVAAGATLLDIGGESARPGAAAVDAKTERARVVPVLEAIRTGTFLIPTMPSYQAQIRNRFEALLDRKLPPYTDVD